MLDLDEALAWLSLMANNANIDDVKRKMLGFMKTNSSTISLKPSIQQGEVEELKNLMDSYEEELLDLVRGLQLDHGERNKCCHVSYIHERIKQSS